MEKDYLRSIGENLRKARLARGLSLRQFSKLCSSDHSDIGKIERGKVNVGVLKLIELAKALRVHPTTILDIEISFDELSSTAEPQNDQPDNP